MVRLKDPACYDENDVRGGMWKRIDEARKGSTEITRLRREHEHFVAISRKCGGNQLSCFANPSLLTGEGEGQHSFILLLHGGMFPRHVTEYFNQLYLT